MSHKYDAAELKNKAASSGLNLNDDQIRTLAEGRELPVSELRLSENRVAAAEGGCQGIKIIDLGGGCGIYIWGFPPKIGVCCQG